MYLIYFISCSFYLKRGAVGAAPHSFCPKDSSTVTIAETLWCEDSSRWGI